MSFSKSQSSLSEKRFDKVNILTDLNDNERIKPQQRRYSKMIFQKVKSRSKKYFSIPS
jgi:hypothetical protein